VLFRTRSHKQRALIVLTLAAGLLITGCAWGTYTDGGQVIYGHAYRVVVHQQASDDTIHHCDADRGSLTEARCVLDVIRYACHAQPVSGWAPAECDLATNHTGTQCRRVPGGDENCAVAMQRAIRQIRAEQGQCLTYEQYLGESSHGWVAIGTPPGC
jgi:hypothetical protein